MGTFKQFVSDKPPAVTCASLSQGGDTRASIDVQLVSGLGECATILEGRRADVQASLSPRAAQEDIDYRMLYSNSGRQMSGNGDLMDSRPSKNCRSGLERAGE